MSRGTMIIHSAYMDQWKEIATADGFDSPRFAKMEVESSVGVTVFVQTDCSVFFTCCKCDEEMCIGCTGRTDDNRMVIFDVVNQVSYCSQCLANTAYDNGVWRILMNVAMAWNRSATSQWLQGHEVAQLYGSAVHGPQKASYNVSSSQEKYPHRNWKGHDLPDLTLVGLRMTEAPPMGCGQCRMDDLLCKQCINYLAWKRACDFTDAIGEDAAERVLAGKASVHEEVIAWQYDEQLNRF